MKTARLLCLGLALAGGWAGAQVNPPDTPPAGSAVMPPAAEAPATNGTANGLQMPGTPQVPNLSQAPGARPRFPGRPRLPARPGPRARRFTISGRPFSFFVPGSGFGSCWGVLAAAALVVLLWRWFGTRAVRKAQTAYDLALERLEQARALMREDDPAPYAVAVSEAVRIYLGQRFGASSTRRTTTEFLRQMEADPSTPLAAHRDLLRDFLEACDLLKFARYRPGLPELERVQERAVSFVTATKPAERPEGEGNLVAKPA